MDNDNIFFSVEQDNGITIIKNLSKYDLFLTVKPIPPKRKHLTISVVPSGKVRVYDGLKLCLSNISFTLEEKK